MNVIDIEVPDIGDFADVEIIEILVKPGDDISVEQSLITVESDKASMEIPSPVAGKLQELKVKVGDKVSKGTVIGTGLAGGRGRRPLAPPAPAAAPPAPAAAAAASAAAAAPRSRRRQRLRRDAATGSGGEGDVQGTGGQAGGGIDRSQGARHRRLQGRRGDRGAGGARRHGRASSRA